jgi:hypothetical protein
MKIATINKMTRVTRAIVKILFIVGGSIASAYFPLEETNQLQVVSVQITKDELVGVGQFRKSITKFSEGKVSTS